MSIEIKKIKELESNTFNIPSYQRGYRWSPKQVEALLKDINEHNGDKPYCIQPLAVVPVGDKKWNVVDGQQRLTTIFLILRCFGVKNIFQLEYESKECPSLMKPRDANVNDSSDKISIDNYYISEAEKEIKNFSENLGDETKEKFIEKLKEKVSFIWYEPNNIDERTLFTRLNQGKIPLTNAELIKAMLLGYLKHEKKCDKTTVLMERIAGDWDRIEQQLHNDEFWHFLNPKGEKIATRIDFMFDFFVKNKPDCSNERYYTYFAIKEYFDKLVKDHKKPCYLAAKKLWKEILEQYHILEDWFYDHTSFHLVGTLRSYDVQLTEIHSSFKDKKCPSRTGFYKTLRDKIKEVLKITQENDILKDADFYNDKDKVRKLLLLFNIAQIINSKQKSMRFSFAEFHARKWDIEHISPQNPPEIIDKDEQKAWLKQFLYAPDLVEDVDLKKEIELFIRNPEKGKFKDLFDKTKKFLPENNHISNLTLLCDSDNRSIGNKPFYKKSEKLKKHIADGSFIPIGTWNVFTKYYTENPESLMFWTKKDSEAYGIELEKNLKKYLGF